MRGGTIFLRWQLLLIALGLGWALSASAETTERVSVASNGDESATGAMRVCADSCTMSYFHNQWPSISRDGRFVVFYSLANNLVSGDDNGYTDVFLRDRETGETSMVSRNGVPANGGSSLPYISQSGDHVSFRSEASNLVDVDINGVGDIYLFGRRSGAMELVSVSDDGRQADGESYNSAVTPNGRYVAFDSLAANLVQGDGNNTYDIFLRDRVAGRTERITVNRSGVEANGPSFDPVMSADGRFIAFYSYADNLVADDTNGASDIFVYDRQENRFELVSVNDRGDVGDSGSVMPSISSDGRVVAFRSFASNLVGNDSNRTHDIFVRNLDTGHTQRINVSSDGIQANAPSIFNAISNDGMRVVFGSHAGNLVAGDTNGRADIFMHDLATGLTERVSVSSDGDQADQASSLPVISGDGRYIAFESFAANLVSNDSNGNKDIFVRDLGPRNRPPVANAGADAAYECSGAGTEVTVDGSLSSDPDNDPLEFSWQGLFGYAEGVTATFHMGLGRERVDLVVEDGQGGTDSDSVHVSVIDSVPPIITMPDSIRLEAESAAGAAYQLEPVYRENCGTSILSVTPHFTVYPLGETTVDIEVVDLGNNVSRHSMSVGVVDSTPPELTAPADIDAEATGPVTPLEIGQAEARDAVGVESLVNDAPEGFALGNTTVTWSATDAAGNAATAEQLVTVSDTKPPSFRAPDDVIAEATGVLTRLDLGAVVARDLVDGEITATNDSPPDGFPLGSTVVTWRATDLSGNTREARQQIEIVDTTAPRLTPPDDISVEAGGEFTPVDIGNATATDIFDVTVSNNAPDAFPVGITIVVWTAEDASGNVVTREQKILVRDTTPPSLTIPDDVVTEANGVMSRVNLGFASAVDLVDGSVRVTNDAPADGYPLGVTMVTWSAADSRGNTVTAVQSVTVHDTTAPELIAPEDITITASGPLTTVDIGDAEADDIFGTKVTNDAPKQFSVGTTLVNWTAEDDNGNVSTAVQTIKVHYAFDGFLPPLRSGKSYFGERAIPVKVSLSYADGSFAGNARIRIALYKVDGGGQEPIRVGGHRHSDSGGMFRQRGNKYLFVLNTKDLESGEYLIEAIPDDDSGSHVISIRYREQPGRHAARRRRD